jgi:hypothetical protein
MVADLRSRTTSGPWLGKVKNMGLKLAFRPVSVSETEKRAHYEQ